MDFLIRLKDADRRIIFVFVAMAVCFPMIFGIDLPVFPSRNVKSLDDYIRNLKPGTPVYLSFDYDPASMPELEPAAVAILVRLFRQGLRPVCGGNWPLGGDMAESSLNIAIKIFNETFEDASGRGEIAAGVTPNPVAGKDYVNLGFKPGALAHILAMTKNFLDSYQQDRDANMTQNMPIFQKADGTRFSMKDFGLLISFTAGTGGIDDYIAASGEHGRVMAAACTSVNIPRFYTYLQTGQLIGLVGGLPGAAEYEALIAHHGPARRAIAPQSVTHMVIIGFILLGNLAYLAEKSKAKKKQA